MRIAFVIQDLFSQGAEYVTALMVRGFVDKGYEVDLIVSRVHKDLFAEGKKPFDVPSQTNWIFLPSRKASRNIFALRKYLKTAEAYAVVIMSINYLKAVRLSAFGLNKCPKIMYVEHLGTVGLDADGNCLPLPNIKQRWFARFWFAKCDIIAAVSTGTKNALARLYPWLTDKLVVVYNPVVDEVFWSKINSAGEAHPWLHTKICPTLIAAGAHTYLKNHFLLMDAIAKCNQIRPVRLVIFGRGSLTAQYEAYIKERKLENCVSLGGYSDNLPLQMKFADGVLVASNVESFSIVLVEALACGCPVVSTDCSYGPREILDNGKYGALVPIRDTQAMTDAIFELLKSDKKPNENPQAWNRFSLETITERYECALGLKEGENT